MACGENVPRGTFSLSEGRRNPRWGATAFAQNLAIAAPIPPSKLPARTTQRGRRVAICRSRRTHTCMPWSPSGPNHRKERNLRLPHHQGPLSNYPDKEPLPNLEPQDNWQIPGFRSEKHKKQSDCSVYNSYNSSQALPILTTSASTSPSFSPASFPNALSAVTYLIAKPVPTVDATTRTNPTLPIARICPLATVSLRCVPWHFNPSQNGTPNNSPFARSLL